MTDEKSRFTRLLPPSARFIIRTVVHTSLRDRYRSSDWIPVLGQLGFHVIVSSFLQIPCSNKLFRRSIKRPLHVSRLTIDEVTLMRTMGDRWLVGAGIERYSGTAISTISEAQGFIMQHSSDFNTVMLDIRISADET